ncbi:MAG: dihydrodipicolinate synthase family protein [Kiritimatiellia bacterium]|jgi:4-hydroxy-tetrahydrodipicolinate synthase|nr:dihydrodipicolinate synthase family protein [Kiritimatiellia bacterium]
MTDIRGICPIIATPFTERGEVDYESMTGLLRTLARGGCHALTLFGIAGEYYKLSEDEMREMIALTVRECRAAGIPSIISITQHATELAVRQARYTEAAGAECLMLLPPFFLKPGGAALFRHIKTVCEAVSLPVMLQYAPEQTGVPIDPALLARLADEVPNLRYYKIECRPPGAYISRLLDLTQGRISVFIGNAGFQMIEGLDRGAVGVMPGCSLFDVYLRIYHAWGKGDRPEALRVHGELLAMLNHIRQDVEEIIFYEKRILMQRGIIRTEVCRNPSFLCDAEYDRLFEERFEAIRPLLG